MRGIRLRTADMIKGSKYVFSYEGMGPNCEVSTALEALKIRRIEFSGRAGPEVARRRLKQWEQMRVALTARY